MSTPTCTDASSATGEPLAGSAPDAVGWVCLEQSGAWGAKAWSSSRLDPSLGATLESVISSAGLRPSLIRRPGRTTDSSIRQVLVASSHPARSWLLGARVSDPATLLSLDFAAVAAGDLEAARASLPVLEVVEDPVLLVCTNGTRDTCCARLGRPIAQAAAVASPERVWEVTHTSGHRFAATTVLLPSGFLHGRVLDAAPLLARADTGSLELAGLRGRSCWPPAGQVAEELVRSSEGITGLDELVVSGAGEDWKVTHADGRSWQVEVTSYPEGERPASCGKDSEPVTRYRALFGDLRHTDETSRWVPSGS